MQCNGFQPEWTNGDNCILSIRDFVQELQSAVFNSPPITMYHSTPHVTTNTFRSVLFGETQMVKTQNVSLWPNLTITSQQFKRFTPKTYGAYWLLGKTHMQCNGFRPEWTNGAKRPQMYFVRWQLCSRITLQHFWFTPQYHVPFNTTSYPKHIWFSTFSSNSNGKKSIWYIVTKFDHFIRAPLSNINDSPPRPPVHMNPQARRILNVTVSDPSEQMVTTVFCQLKTLSKNYTPVFSIHPQPPHTIQH